MILSTKDLDCGKGLQYLYSEEIKTMSINNDEFLF